jgi:hypothetical protein
MGAILELDMKASSFFDHRDPANSGSVYKLVYTEVYTKKNEKWNLVNLHTTSGHF